MRGKRAPGPVAPQPAPHRKARIMFAVPSESGNVNWSIAHQMARMMWNTAQPECQMTFATTIKAGVRPIQYVRNQIAAEFLASDADWLIMVDDDQVVPENFWQLCTVQGADVVSGKTYCWVGNGYKEGRLRVNQYGLVKRPEIEYPECYNLFPEPTDTPYPVQVIGTGCIAIRRHVLEALGPNPFQFTYKPNGSIQAGEDVNFSIRLANLGFNILVHPGVQFGHVKTIDLALVDEYAAARVQFEAAGRVHRPVDVLSIGA